MLQTETALVYDAVQLFAVALTAAPHLSDVRMTMLQTETALVYDAVQLFAVALTAAHLTDVRMTSLSCNQDRAWKHGASIINFIKAVTSHYINQLV